MPETPKRIHLLGSGRHEEAIAGGAITPGMLIKLDSAGEVVVHATQGGPAEKLFALEDALQGNSIDDAYATDDLVGYVAASPGDVVYAYLDVGENVVIGDLLVSAGNGSLEKRTSTYIALAIALEALNLSDSEHAAGRIRVRIL